MDKVFTSIFHEAIIVNEFKGEAEAAHAARRLADMSSGMHNKNYDSTKDAKDYRDGKDHPATKPAKNAGEARARQITARSIRDSEKFAIDSRERSRERRKALVGESFLPEIELI